MHFVNPSRYLRRFTPSGFIINHFTTGVKSIFAKKGVARKVVKVERVWQSSY